jgi:hypothetical protein
MALKLFAGIVAIALMLAYLLPMILKLKAVALGTVILIAFTMMLIDLWQSLQARDE